MLGSHMAYIVAEKVVVVSISVAFICTYGLSTVGSPTAYGYGASCPVLNPGGVKRAVHVRGDPVAGVRTHEPDRI